MFANVEAKQLSYHRTRLNNAAMNNILMLIRRILNRVISKYTIYFAENHQAFLNPEMHLFVYKIPYVLNYFSTWMLSTMYRKGVWLPTICNFTYVTS